LSATAASAVSSCASFHAWSVAQGGLEDADLGAQLLLALAGQVLRAAQPLVAQHLAQEAAALGGAHRRQELQLLLPGEVGVEELLAGHPQPLLEIVRRPAQRGRHRLRPAVQEHLGVVERAHHAVLLLAQGELEIDLHP
jgi:hypothetical protein